MVRILVSDEYKILAFKLFPILKCWNMISAVKVIIFFSVLLALSCCTAKKTSHAEIHIPRDTTITPVNAYNNLFLDSIFVDHFLRQEIGDRLKILLKVLMEPDLIVLIFSRSVILAWTLKLFIMCFHRITIYTWTGSKTLTWRFLSSFSRSKSNLHFLPRLYLWIRRVF